MKKWEKIREAAMSVKILLGRLLYNNNALKD
jgi:hypothetical protein